MAVDTFRDKDLRAIAQSIKVSSFHHNNDGLIQALDQLDPHRQATILYGAGVDRNPGLLAILAKHRSVPGNTAETALILSNPRRFFHILQHLGINHPTTCFSRPPSGQSSPWLIKHSTSYGGQAVRQFNPNASINLSGEYYQRHVSGRCASIVFLAHNHMCSMLGFFFNKTYAQGAHRWLYVGSVSAHHKLFDLDYWSDIITNLSATLNLRGLNGLDFILDQKGRGSILEINGRPTSGFELLPAPIQRQALQAHIDGTAMTAPNLSRSDAQAKYIIVAPRHCQIDPDMTWPDWIVDRPISGASIAADQPICTVLATGKNTPQAWALAQRRKSSLLGQIYQAKE